MPAVLETRSDCDRCAALCCIAYPSEDMPGFSAIKSAGEPCPKLGGNGLCTIYEHRAEKGFAGCIRFECFGAGQHVVQYLFAGNDWRNDLALLGPMVDAFLAMRPVADLNFLAQRAHEMTDKAELRDKATVLAERLENVAQSRSSLNDTAEVAAIERELRALYQHFDR